MPRPRPLGPEPSLRPNWDSLNEGQRRYAYEQWNLAKVRRGIPIDHPIPSISDDEDEVIPPSRELEIPETPASVPGSIEIPETPRSTQGSIEIPETPRSQPVAGPSRMSHPLFEEDQLMSGEVTPAKRTSSEVIPPTPSKRRLMAASRRLPGSGAGQGSNSQGLNDMGGGESMTGETIEDPRAESPFTKAVQYMKIQKVHRVLTSGIAYRLLPSAFEGNRIMITPAACFPVNKIIAYMSEDEFNTLPMGTKIEKCKVTVKARNVRQAFQTSSTASTLASLNQNKDVFYGIGLLQKVPSVNVHPETFNDTEPMVVESIQPAVWDKWDRYRYGFLNTDAEFNTNIPDHQVGYPFPLRNYLALVTPNNMNRNRIVGFPCFQKYINVIDATANVNKDLCVWEHTSKNGWLKPIPYITGTTDGSTYTMYNGWKRTTSEFCQFTASTNTPENMNKGSTDVQSAPPDGWSPDRGIDRAVDLRTGIHDPQDAVYPPSLHFGCLPAPALTTAAIIADETPKQYIDTQAEFELTCDCIISIHYEFEFARCQTQNHHKTHLWVTQAGTAGNAYDSDSIHILDMLTHRTPPAKDVNVQKKPRKIIE